MNAKFAYFFLSAAASFLVMGALGTLLPRTSVLAARTTVRAPIETVWAGLKNVEAYPKWRAKITQSERQPSSSDRRLWLEHSPAGTARWTLTEESIPTRLTLRLLEAPTLAHESREYLLKTNGSETELEVRVSVQLHSPWMRFLDAILGLRRTALQSELRLFAATLR